MKNRTERVYLLLSKEDGEHFKDAATTLGLSLTKYLVFLGKSEPSYKGLTISALVGLQQRLVSLSLLACTSEFYINVYDASMDKVMYIELVNLSELLDEVILIIEDKKNLFSSVINTGNLEKSDTEKKEDFNFKLTKEEKELLKSKASDAMLTVSEYVIEVMYDREVKSRKKIIILNDIRNTLRGILNNTMRLSEALVAGNFCFITEDYVDELIKKILVVLGDIFYLLE